MAPKWCSIPEWEMPMCWEMSRRLEPWYPCSANISAAPSRISSLRPARAAGSVSCALAAIFSVMISSIRPDTLDADAWPERKEMFLASITARYGL